MRNIVFVAAAVTLAAVPIAKSQEATPLTDYLDANGFLDVQALTCAQLAGTYQEDADMLMAWYSGWYNGLARKHEMHYTRGKEVEHCPSSEFLRQRAASFKGGSGSSGC